MPGLNMEGSNFAPLTLAALLLIPASSSNASTKGQGEPSTTSLPAVHAIHSTPGPRIWQFKKGSTTLLVLGTVQPLRQSLPIDTRGIEAAISTSEAILSSPGVTMEHDGGLLRSLMLWPSIRKLKFLADGRTLRDELTVNEYMKWSELKHLYGMRDASTERMRPMYAAWKVHDAALKLSGIRTGRPLSQSIERMARQHRIPIVNARFAMPVKADRKTIQRFHIDSANDHKCFAEATSSLQPWLDEVDELGRAWAEGDIDSRALLQAPPSPSRCWVRLTNDAIGNTMNLNLDVASRLHWVKVLHSTTSRYNRVFTTLPLQDLLHSKGMAAVLLEEGYIPDAEVFFGDQPQSPDHATSRN